MGFSEQSGGWRQRIMLAAAGLILIVAVVLAWRGLSSGPRYRISAERAFKCAECGEVFEHVLQIGDKEPFECPACDRPAGWATEKCYWTKDGKAKLDPTFVILKTRLDPDSDEKTYCPDCGREIKGHNPRPPKELMDAARAEAER